MFMLSCMVTFAQGFSQIYVRVSNAGSGRYVYVADCTGKASASVANMDMGALETRPNLADAVSDPGSVIFVEMVDNQFDLTAQATGVHAMIGSYLDIWYDEPYFFVQNSGQYLYETGNSDSDENVGVLGVGTNANYPGRSIYRMWNVMPIDSGSDNYFGFKPSVNAGGKYYAPFYADFAYTPKNNVKTWYVSQVDKKYGVAVMKEISGTVARKQAVFVECPSASPSGNKIDLTVNAGSSATGNLMKGAFFCNGPRTEKNHAGKDPAAVEFDAKTMRMLGVDDEGKLAFVSSSANLVNTKIYKGGNWVEALCVPHNQSYLTVDSDCPAQLKVMTEAEYAAYVEEMEKEPEVLIGDVNGDGRVTITDVACIVSFIVKADTTGLNQKAADANGDGKVTVTDIAIVVDKIVNKK